MRRLVTMKSSVMFPLILELLDHQLSVRIIVTGKSMMPFLRENIDSVELVRKRFDEVRKGQIVLIKRDSGTYVLHRVIRKEEASFFIVGDNQRKVEGPLRQDQLLAGVACIWRGNKKIGCDNKLLRLASALWLALLPFRDIIKAIFKYPCRFIHKLQMRM